MRTIPLNEIDQTIEKNRKKVNAVISSSSYGHRKKSRTRAPGEVIALNEISIVRWQKAIEEKKIIKTGNGRCIMTTVNDLLQCDRTF